MCQLFLWNKTWQKKSFFEIMGADGHELVKPVQMGELCPYRGKNGSKRQSRQCHTPGYGNKARKQH